MKHAFALLTIGFSIFLLFVAQTTFAFGTPFGGRITSTVDSDGNYCPGSQHPEGPLTINFVSSGTGYPFSIATGIKGYGSNNLAMGTWILGIRGTELSDITACRTPDDTDPPTPFPTTPITLFGTSQ